MTGVTGLSRCFRTTITSAHSVEVGQLDGRVSMAISSGKANTKTLLMLLVFLMELSKISKTPNPCILNTPIHIIRKK